MKNQNIKFGVENLSICNLESLCLLDMKVFLYSCLFQTISYVKGKSSNRTDFFIQPYWLQDNLCEENQFDWWFHCANYLFKSNQQQLQAAKSKQNQLVLLDDTQLTLNLNLDVKKQNELIKILELIRLKASMVFIKNTDFKFKVNLKILINLTNYLQYLCNNEQKVFTANAYNSEYILFSPKQMVNFLKQYLIKYWHFLTKHLVNLKQVISTNNLDETANFDQINSEFMDLSNLDDSIALQFSSAKQMTSLYGQYFKFYKSADSFFEETSRLMSNFDLRDTRRLSCLVNQQKNEYVDYYDSIIKNGLLNLILLNIKGMDDTSAFDDEEKSQKLREAINLFDLMEKSLNEKTKHELNSNQLKVYIRFFYF